MYYNDGAVDYVMVKSLNISLMYNLMRICMSYLLKVNTRLKKLHVYIFMHLLLRRTELIHFYNIHTYCILLGYIVKILILYIGV